MWWNASGARPSLPLSLSLSLPPCVTRAGEPEEQDLCETEQRVDAETDKGG